MREYSIADLPVIWAEANNLILDLYDYLIGLEIKLALSPENSDIQELKDLIWRTKALIDGLDVELVKMENVAAEVLA